MKEFKYFKKQLTDKLATLIDHVKAQGDRLNQEGNEDYKNVFKQHNYYWIEEKELVPEREKHWKDIIDLNTLTEFILNVNKIRFSKDTSLEVLRDEVR